jgi:hypothetical protein
MMLIGTTLLTLSHHTVSMSGVGSLKCYATGGIEKACWIGGAPVIGDRVPVISYR